MDAWSLISTLRKIILHCTALSKLPLSCSITAVYCSKCSVVSTKNLPLYISLHFTAEMQYILDTKIWQYCSGLNKAVFLLSNKWQTVLQRGVSCLADNNGVTHYTYPPSKHTSTTLALTEWVSANCSFISTDGWDWCHHYLIGMRLFCQNGSGNCPMHSLLLRNANSITSAKRVRHR